MKKLTALIFFSLLTSLAHGDSICAPKKLKGKVNGSNVTIKLKDKLAVKSSCASNEFAVADTSTFVGPAGPAGPQGADGADGSFASGLLSGQTIVGYFDCGDFASGAGVITTTSISFLSPASVVPIVTVIEDGEPTTANCTGSVASPTAASGHLCVYEFDRVGTAQLSTDGLGTDGGAEKQGTAIYCVSSQAGLFFSRGVWAYTEP